MHYEVSIKSDKTMEDGLIKNVTEKYLVEAVSFAEAETRAAEYITDYVSGEYDICAIRRLKVSELFYSSDSAADRWYSAKLSFITVDEKKGKEKKITQLVMVLAKDFDDARSAIQEGLKGTLGDWEQAQLKETNILDIIKYEVPEETEDNK